MRILQVCGGLIAAIWLAVAPVKALAGSMTLLGAGKAGASYQGPLDVFTASPYAAYSCARALSASVASTTGNLCDLVDSAAPTTVICTLKALTTGKVDLAGTYCTGGLTPSAKCAAATGGVCNISKAYDQTGNGRDASQATAASQPTLLFSSSPTGTLPVMNCNAGGSRILATASVTAAQPLTLSGVLYHVAVASNGNAFGADFAAVFLTVNGSNAIASGGTSLTSAVSDATWYAVQGLLNGNGTSSAVNVNGSDTTGAAGTTGFSANTVRLCRANSAQHGGYIAEALIWAAASNSADRGNIATNQRSSTNGYNF